MLHVALPICAMSVRGISSWELSLLVVPSPEPGRSLSRPSTPRSHLQAPQALPPPPKANQDLPTSRLKPTRSFRSSSPCHANPSTCCQARWIFVPIWPFRYGSRVPFVTPSLIATDLRSKVST
ncbi:hypothetical protein B0H17DRAFT_1063766 [Mycena rosella]|uniref:Uncharacterized protein n=1 Tax=Mycena rosella TaxID=1033263 RepID=A0AAD7GIR8_MYCRO|nr:hypothetical protein B0H17DRAFT_1063766 [Mycena rosella]